MLELATGFKKGMGSEELCGAVTGLVLVINYFYGRSDLSQSTRAPKLVAKFIRKFKNRSNYL
ncbi:C-GCAxxG-C-C family protein [Orenia marismortui]|uniref:C-GCAxxG-C-C family protein n=1 Tax=Orenia marismortui TaxID=46469 RepID=UPI0023EA598F|nr:C-GCAxxG-C-C family protein [Orenia marismortui]